MFKKIKLTKENINWGVTAFLVIAAALVFYFLLKNLPGLGEFLSKLGSALMSFLWGFVIAYFVSPLMKRLEKKMPKWAAVAICILVVILVLIALVLLVVPQLIESIEMIIQKSPDVLNNIRDKTQVWFQNTPAVEELLEDLEVNATSAIKQILPSVADFVSKFSSGVYTAFSEVFDVIIGIIVASYLLANYDVAIAGVKKVLYSLLPITLTEKIIGSMEFISRTFRSYVNGKLLDSLMVGIICYIFCLITQMPYSLLISVLVAVTNIIPYFGPFLGAIPSALLILMVSPSKCLIFVIFIVIMQQIEGNILEPAIVGQSVGMNGFWVLLATLAGGAMFGVAGMILGIPVFFCIYTALEIMTDKRLLKKDLPVPTAEYIDLDHIDPETHEAVYKE